MLFYCIFNGNYVSDYIKDKPAIHLAVQTVYTTAYTILEHPHREFKGQLFLPKFRFPDIGHFEILTCARLPPYT